MQLKETPELILAIAKELEQEDQPIIDLLELNKEEEINHECVNGTTARNTKDS